MFSYDKEFIHTWEIERGLPKRPLRLKITPLSGQIVCTPLDVCSYFNHSAVLLGFDVESISKTWYVCSKGPNGVHIERLREGARIRSDSRISQSECLRRLAAFFNDSVACGRVPSSYNVLVSNCQNFCHSIVYGCDVNLLLLGSVALFLLSFCNFKKNKS